MDNNPASLSSFTRETFNNGVLIAKGSHQKTNFIRMHRDNAAVFVRKPAHALYQQVNSFAMPLTARGLLHILFVYIFV